MNIVQIIGNLGADPETRFTASGQKVTSLRVACNTRKSGNDETTWWRVTVWGDRFDKMMTYLKKGSSVIVVGSMSPPEIYSKEGGQPQVSLNLTAEMLMFPPLPKKQAGGEKSEGGEEMSYAGETKRASSKQYDLEEEHESLPF